MDRDEVRDPKPWKFGITRTYSILNGFFTRIATTEVVLEWSQPNIYSGFNDTFAVDISGVGPFSVTLPGQSFTVADALDYIIADLNGQTAPTHVFSIGNLSGTISIDLSGGTFDISPGVLANQLNVPVSAGNGSFKLVSNPDLRPWRYLDFISAELTYNQDLKDASTCPIVRDVLCRWYFDWDTVPDLDAYGFPILMGYTAFKVRRLFNPPKQIRWDTRQPVGNLTFEVYGQNSVYTTGIALADFYAEPEDSERSEWLMTLQISEV
jgi:hypothetical protein